MAEDADGNVPPAILTPGGEELSEKAIARDKILPAESRMIGTGRKPGWRPNASRN
jgi:hypothetical protein